MAHPFFAILHGGHGAELTLLAYLYRVLLHLFALAGVALLAYWWSEVVDAFQSTFFTGRGSEDGRRRTR